MTAPSRVAGFALPAVLTVVSMLTLIVLVCILTLKGARERSFAASREVEAERAALSVEGRVAYLAATNPLSSTAIRIGGARLGPTDLLGATHSSSDTPDSPTALLRLDDAPYRWKAPNDPAATGFIVSVQDGAGLFDLNTRDKSAVTRLLTYAGVTIEDAATLSDELLDYTRSGDLDSLKGLDSNSGPRAGMPGLQGRLFRPSQVFGLPNWAKLVRPEAWRRIEPLATADPVLSGLNANTAPPEVLAFWFGLTPDAAHQLVKARTEKPLQDLAALNPGSAGELGYGTWPNGVFRLTLIDPATGWAYRYRIVLTPADRERPVFEEALEPMHRAPEPSTEVDQLAPLPEPTPPLSGSLWRGG